MKKISLVLLVLMLFCAKIQAQTTQSPILTEKISGIYGVLNSMNNSIILNVNEDFTFTFEDIKSKVKITGDWKVKRNRTVFNYSLDNKNIKNQWTFSTDGQIVKFRIGFSFYRLCKIT
ncbi:MAG: hypothetical protein H6578_03240 [Chitinophagales bacterium]|nr:hypothetical protein [Chitinophagales bacterium]